MLFEELNQNGMADRLSVAEERLDKDIETVKNNKDGNLKWNDLAASTMDELMNNLWELKEDAKKFLVDIRMKRKKSTRKNILIAIKAIEYYNNIRHKLNRLKTEIFEYNKRFQNNQIPNVEELIDSKIKASVKSSLKEEIIRYCRT